MATKKKKKRKIEDVLKKERLKGKVDTSKSCREQDNDYLIVWCDRIVGPVLYFKGCVF